jgi:hypothetical protein
MAGMSGTQPSTKHVRVFVSYSHDSLEHRERVLQFSNKLRLNGIEAVVDRYFEDTLEMRWIDWMNEQIDSADFVLVVATPEYSRRLKPGNATGQGAYWEGALISQFMYDAHGENKKFIPIYFTAEDAPSIPVYLKGFQNYNVATDDGYVDLYRRVTNQPGVLPPAVGKIVNPNTLYGKRPAPAPSSPREDAVRQRIDELARAYQEIRKTMLPGDARTRKMEIIAAKMRTLACDAYFLLDYLARNPEPGSRLAAVSLLEAKPNPDYLSWLSERLAPEKPFVGYHAALALFVAARTMEYEFRPQLREAIEKARALLGTGLETTDRARALAAALAELQESETVIRDFALSDRPLPS